MISLLFVACTTTEPVQKPTKSLNIQTTSYPVHYITERLLPKISIKCVLPPGEDPPDWNPNAEQIAQMGQSDLIIANGANFEKWMQTASLPQSKTLYAAQGLSFITLKGKTHSHGKKGAHSHAGVDPHVWSNPIHYQKQATKIAEALKKVDPGKNQTIDANLSRLKEELTILDANASKIFSSLRNIHFAANHHQSDNNPK